MDKNYSKNIEKKWQRYWIENNIYRFNLKSKKQIFSLDTPPPTVSGEMHLGHALGYSQADFIMRFWRMNNKNIFYPFGFDDNGLATERFVENKLNIKGRDMDRDEFIKLCLKETREVERRLKKDWESLGISPDWNINYRTIDDWSRKISQKSFIELYKKGREYQKEAPTIWCPECGTAIAQVELKDKELSSTFNDVLFEVEGKTITISTTRPELLPSCVAIFVNSNDERYKYLIGKKARVPLFTYKVPILGDDQVDMEKGSGIVMCCTFGDLVDIDWWYTYNLPLRIAISKDGIMEKICGKYNGLTIKEARKSIIDDLRKNNLLISQRNIKHAVNVHERCETEIEFLVTKQWFVKYLDLKKKFLDAGKKLNWYPKYMKIRYDNWIKGLKWDWLISRQRFFGIPFPVWYCKRCNKVKLANDSELPVDPIKDKPKGKCECGCMEFIPEKDVLDTWATSSLTPMIASKWKKDNKFFNKIYPMSLRSNGHDIITFWLFNTVVKGLLHENKLPWKDVMINGFVLDPKGKKMSKSKGNVIDPLDMINKYGADSLRFWAASSKLGDDIPFQEKELRAGKRFAIKLWNASRFSLMHLKDFKFRKVKLELIDRWLLYKLNKIIEISTENFKRYEYSKTKSEVENFFWNVFCDYYLEIIKDRLYNEKKRGKIKKKSAQYTLYYSLLTILKLYAPIMPHLTEEIYQSYFKKREKFKSIHISEWPKYKKEKNKKLEDVGNEMLDIISKVRKFKAKHNKSLKEPVKITLNKSKLKNVLDDLKAVVNAEEIRDGKFKVEF